MSRRGKGGRARDERRPQQAEPRRINTAPGTHLGDFGTAEEQVDATFGWFGTNVRINPALSELALIDFAEAAATIDENSPEAIVSIKTHLRTYIHPDDFDEFWQLALAKRQGVAKLMEVMHKLMEKLTDRPTVRPSDSSDGPHKTGPSSKGDFSFRVQRRLEAEGRPDLALAVVQAREAQAAG